MDKLVVGWNAVEGMSQLAVYRGVECPLSTVVVCYGLLSSRRHFMVVVPVQSGVAARATPGTDGGPNPTTRR